MIRSRDVRRTLAVAIALIPSLAVAQKNQATITTNISSDDIRATCPIDVMAALRSVPQADRPDMSRVMECNKPGNVYIGMDAGFSHASPDEGDGANLFSLPMQRLRVTFPVGPQFRLEVPLSLSYDHTGDVSSTSLGTGLIGDLMLSNLLGSPRPPGTGFYAGIGGVMHYDKFDDESDTQFGALGRAGYEFPFNDTRMRLGVFFEKRFESDESLGGNVFGATLGMSVPLAGEEYQVGSGIEGVDRVTVEFFSGAHYQKPSDGDGTTSIAIPVPTFGLFFQPGDQHQLKLGIRTGINYASDGDNSIRDITVAPRVEYNLNRDIFSTQGIRLGAHGIIDNFNFDYGSDDAGGTQYGVGGDVSLTLPKIPTLFVVGVGVDRMFKSEDAGRRAATVFRLEIGIDRYFFKSR